MSKTLNIPKRPEHGRSSSSLPAPEITPRRKKTKSCFPENPTHTGRMLIRSGDTPGYSRRYFCLKHKFLVSARTQKSRKLERVIPLEGTTETRTSKSSFEVVTKRKVYHFKCATAEECETWVQLLKKAAILTLHDIYKIGRTLGISETQSTKVIEGRHHVTGDRVAIKIIDKKRCDSRLLQSEVHILKKIQHDCVVQLYDIFETARYLHLVMELCEGGELFERLVSLGEGGHYDEVQCCNIIHQIARGVKYMHSNGIVHRDLKPENILCKDNSVREVKVADFGISKVLSKEQTHMRTMCGTLSYLAPEVLKGRPYDHRVDYWSLGVIMYLLLSGKPPFEASGDSQLTKSILTDDINLDTKEWDHVSMPAKNLVKNLLSRDPSRRGTLDDVLKLTWRESTDKESFRLARHNLKKHVDKANKLRRMSCDMNPYNKTLQRFSLKIVGRRKPKHNAKLEQSPRKSRSRTPVMNSSSNKKLRNSLQVDANVEPGSTVRKTHNSELGQWSLNKTNPNKKLSRNPTPSNSLQLDRTDFSGESPSLSVAECKRLDDWIFENKEEEKESQSDDDEVLICNSMHPINPKPPPNGELGSSKVLKKVARNSSDQQMQSCRISNDIKTLKVTLPKREWGDSSSVIKTLKAGQNKRELRYSSKPSYRSKFSRVHKARQGNSTDSERNRGLF